MAADKRGCDEMQSSRVGTHQWPQLVAWAKIIRDSAGEELQDCLFHAPERIKSHG